jgi:hypothetical protein
MNAKYQNLSQATKKRELQAAACHLNGSFLDREINYNINSPFFLLYLMGSLGFGGVGPRI